MATKTTQIFLGDTPIPFYYVGEDQVGLFPTTQTSLPLNGLIYAFDATNVESYPGSGSIWYDLSPNRVFAAPFSSSTFPTFNSTNSEFTFNGTNQALMATISSSIATGSRIADFTQITWVKLPDVQTGTERGLVNLQFGTSAGVNFDAISFNQDSDLWRLTSDNLNRNVNATQGSTFEQYSMITATRAAGTGNFKVYRNTTLIGSGSFTPLEYGALASNNLYSTIGQRFFNTTGGLPAFAADGWISGSVSSVILYNRALSEVEIANIFEAGRTGIII